MKIISLIGYPRAGKNLLVKIVKTLIPDLRVAELAYADKLKELHMLELGIPSLVEYNNMLHSGISYNNLNLRDDIARLSRLYKSKDIQYFVKELDTKLNNLRDIDVVFITDLRYTEEYLYSIDNQHTIIKVDRPGGPSYDITKPWNEMIESFTVDDTVYNNNNLLGYTTAIEEVVFKYIDITNHERLDKSDYIFFSSCVASDT